jgi:hypothetical protein
MFKCEICGLEFVKLHGLSIHISNGHKIKIEEYYLKYINPEKGKCKTCGNDTKFINLRHEYHIFCSYKCSANNLETRQKYKETCIKKYDCESTNQVEEVKNKKKETFMKNWGFENPMQNKEISNKSKELLLLKNNGIYPYKLTYKKCKEKYPLLVQVEGLIEGSNGEILAHCKNANCKNSEENGGYFEPTIYQLNWRKQGIDKNDTSYLYCCEECKKECPLFNRSSSQLNNLITGSKDKPYIQAEYNIWREEVFLRQRIEYNIDYNFCEHCQSKENLHTHHIQPIKLYPGYALDPDNGIIFCEDCHYEIGHETGTECSTGNLASKICK